MSPNDTLNLFLKRGMEKRKSFLYKKKFLSQLINVEGMIELVIILLALQKKLVQLGSSLGARIIG